MTGTVLNERIVELQKQDDFLRAVAKKLQNQEKTEIHFFKKIKKRD